jgi:hypothetical protein
LWEAKHGGRGDREIFKIEKWWMQQKEFRKLVKRVWSSKVEGEKVIGRWKNKIRLLRKKVREWSTNTEAEVRKRKKGFK